MTRILKGRARMKTFALEGQANCVNCNWEQPVLYAVGRTEADAYLFYQQNGGLCAECYMALATGRESAHAPSGV